MSPNPNQVAERLRRVVSAAFGLPLAQRTLTLTLTMTLTRALILNSPYS